jgi:hypothetical protein
MELKIVELASGWGNVPNTAVLADDYYDTPLCARELSGCDTPYTVRFDGDRVKALKEAGYQPTDNVTAPDEHGIVGWQFRNSSGDTKWFCGNVIVIK